MKDMEIASLTEYDKSLDLIPVRLLESLEAAPCRSGVVHANVYKVQVPNTNDTVYVFEMCQKMLWSKSSKGIFVAELAASRPTHFRVPSTMDIPPRSLFVFANIKRLEY